MSMDQQLNVSNLQHLAVPTVGLKRHQAYLKQSLVTAARPDKHNRKVTWGDLMTKKKVLATASMLVVILLAAATVSVVAPQSPHAYAESVANNSFHGVSRLSSDQLEALNQRLQSNALDELNAAKQAKDLQILTYAEFQKLEPQQVQQLSTDGPISQGAGPTSLDSSSLKYLKFTDANGATHIIGVDKSGMPIMVMIFNNQNGTESGTVQMMGENGQPGAQGGWVSAGGAPAPGTQPATTGCRNVDGQMHCTTNGGQGAQPTCQTTADGKVSCIASGSAQAKQ